MTHSDSGSPDDFWQGRTFDDFLLRPQKGRADSRRNIALSSKLAESIGIELPIVSANMDSVTGYRMAQAMALEGGLGVVHRASSIERQVECIRLVKRSRSAVIEHPLCIPVGTTIGQARSFARKNNITGILVVGTGDDSNILYGLLSSRDMPWSEEEDGKLVDEFMTPHDRVVTGRPNIGMEEAARLMFEKRVERLPVVDEARRVHGLITRKDIRFFRERPLASKDVKGRLRVGAAVGVRGDYLERAAAVCEAGADCLFVDIAHGHSAVMEEAVAQLRKHLDRVPLICGNVATGEGARFLRDISADGIKIGVGPGSGCRTRLETAAGVPQLQAIREAYEAVGDEVPLIADGGIRYDKDIFLALICGASTVMLGGALSGTEEAPGRVIEDPATGQKRKIYRGMTSPQAVYEALYDDDESGALESALQTPSEGQEVQVPFKGSVGSILHRIRGHLQSSVSYVGEVSLVAARHKVMPHPARFLIPLSEPSRRESFER